MATALTQKQQPVIGFPERKLRSSARKGGKTVTESSTGLTPKLKGLSVDVTPVKIRELKQTTPSKRKILGEVTSENVTPPKRVATPKKETETDKENSPQKRCSPRKKLFSTPTTTTPRPATPSRDLFSTPVGRILSTPSTPMSSAKKQLLFHREKDARAVEAKKSLSTSVPDEVVGRSKELEAMRAFLKGAWQDKKKKPKRSLYVSGAPGTGKTACLKYLLDVKGVEEMTKVKVIFINCMSLSSAKEVYNKVAVALDPAYDGVQAKKYVEAKICAKGNKNVLLVLDEMDQLDSKDQDVLYSLFEWPYLKNSKLAVVGIANSLDLTDRILPRLKVKNNYLLLGSLFNVINFVFLIAVNGKFKSKTSPVPNIFKARNQ